MEAKSNPWDFPYIKLGYGPVDDCLLVCQPSLMLLAYSFELECLILHFETAGPFLW